MVFLLPLNRVGARPLNLERDDIYDVIFVVIRPSEFEESPQKTPTCLTIQ